MQKPLKQTIRPLGFRASPFATVLTKLLLDTSKQLVRDDRFMFARVDLATIADLAAVSGRRHLVAGSLRHDLSFKLRERGQDVQRQPSHRLAGIKVLSD